MVIFSKRVTNERINIMINSSMTLGLGLGRGSLFQGIVLAAARSCSEGKAFFVVKSDDDIASLQQ